MRRIKRLISRILGGMIWLLIGFGVGVWYEGYTQYRDVFLTHPEIFAAQSAPWNVWIYIVDAIVVVIAVLLLIIRFMLREKKQRDRAVPPPPPPQDELNPAHP